MFISVYYDHRLLNHQCWN